MLLFVFPLAGCSTLVDSEAARLCRSVLPALHAADSRIEIVTLEELKSIAGSGPAVVIGYTVADGQSAAKPHHATCEYATGDASRSRPRLAALSTEAGKLGPLRLHLLQRLWIESGLAALADPAPIARLGPVPRLPANAALALQQALAALPSIAIYGLLAAAYALIYGLVGRINLAFGELAMLAGYGAFLGFSLIGDNRLGWALIVGFALGLYTCLTQAAALGRFVFGALVSGDNRYAGQHVLIATVGLSIAWSETVRLMQGSGSRWMAPLLSRPIAIARSDTFLVTLTPMALLVFLIAAVAAVTTIVGLERSHFGRTWRATADDPVAAGMLGVDPAAVLTRTMLLAAALTGLAGILTAFFYGGVGHAGGLVLGLKALIAAIIGGIGSVPGALAGGIIIGIVETVWSAAFRIEYRDAAIFTLLAAALVLRPEGLLGWREHQPRRM